MKIWSRLKLNALLSVTTVLVVSLVITAAFRIQRETREERLIANDLAKGAYELDVFSNTYLRHLEERPREQWLIKYHSLLKSIEKMPSQKTRQKVLKNRMKDSLIDLKVLFDNVVGIPAEGSSPELTDLLASLMLTKSREISLNAGRLAVASDKTIQKINRDIEAGLPIVIFVVTMVTVWLSLRIGKSITGPIRNLRAGTEAIGSGNLDYRIGKVSEDELGELSLSFDQMTEKLRATTVSLDELAREAAERKQAEGQLRSSEGRYRALINASVQVLYSMSPDWSVMQQLQGGTFLAETERPNSNWIQEYIHPDDQKRVLEVIGKAVRSGTVFELEHRVRRTDGTLGWTFSRAVPMLNATGEIVEWFGAASDITDRKQAEEELRKAKDELEVRVLERTEELSRALQELRTQTGKRIQAVEELRRKEHMLMQQSRLAALGEMLVNISHQWRQPLNVLGIILQEMNRNYQRGNFTGEYLAASVERARGVITHMSQTIDDFRNFFKPDKIKTSFDVKEVVETTISMVRDSLNELQVDVRMDAEDTISIEGYRNEYAQATMNIVVNARDAFRERKIENPELNVKIFVENGRSVVTIADNAGGIAGDVLEKVFDPYFTTKDPDKGTGIGLFMSKTIIEKNMNGSLTVRNTDEGAEFRIEV